MLKDSTLKNIQYYASYQLGFVVIFIILSSIGAFFHFLLNHEISIVESWIHNNHWEILILSKLIALFLLNRWFRMRLYQMKSVRELINEYIRWPEPKATVVSFFMIVSYLALGKVNYTGQNLGYWYHHLTSFLGLFLFFGIEFIVIAYLDDVLNQNAQPSQIQLGIVYTILFGIAYRLSVPDYYQLLAFVVFCFSSSLYLSGKAFRSWSNVVCFLLLFVAPMGALFGMDPVWGDDFSPFQVRSKLGLSFLAVIWMVSFCYYKFRDQFAHGIRKLFR